WSLHGIRPYGVLASLAECISALVVAKMPSPGKRPAVPGIAPSQVEPPSRKRKMDSSSSSSETKYYAVRAGFKPGIYTSWAICQQQITGFKGAQCAFGLSRPPAAEPPAALADSPRS